MLRQFSVGLVLSGFVFDLPFSDLCCLANVCLDEVLVASSGHDQVGWGLGQRREEPVCSRVDVLVC